MKLKEIFEETTFPAFVEALTNDHGEARCANLAAAYVLRRLDSNLRLWRSWGAKYWSEEADKGAEELLKAIRMEIEFAK